MERPDITLGELLRSEPFGLMSPLTSLCFLLVGASLVALPDSRRRHSLRAFASLGLSVVLLVTCTIFALGYLYGSPLLYGGTIVPPALPAILGLASLGAALLDLARQSAWPPHEGEETSGRSILALVLVFVIVATGIVTTGYLIHQGAEERYRAEVDSGLAAGMAQKADELAEFRKERLEEAGFFRQKALCGPGASSRRPTDSHRGHSTGRVAVEGLPGPPVV